MSAAIQNDLERDVKTGGADVPAAAADASIKLRVSEPFKAEIETAAESLHISVSALARLAMAEYIRVHAPQASHPDAA